jgi:RND family efflux transporter MFP subunit
MKHLLFIPIAIVLFLLAHSCSSGKAEDKNLNESDRKISPTPVSVTTTLAVNKTFYHEIICNGIIEAGRSARIGFETHGIIEELHISNGQIVQKGQLLARLNSDEQQMALQRARNTLLRAKVDMKDFLLGYSSNTDSASIPPQVMQTARIRTGFAEAELSVKELELRFEKTLIKSPFNGRVVDLKAKPHNPTNSYDYLCYIVDEQSLQVSFNVMESELEVATIGSEVLVFPFSNSTNQSFGTITETNRMVDKSGMVRVVASLKQTNSSIIQGMNVRVLVRKADHNKLVIPIEGLTRRQNRDVVFVLSDSLAYWQYVEIGARNTTEVIILDGLEQGDKVIVSGNATIGHEAWVKEE